MNKDKEEFIKLAKYVKENTNDKELKIHANSCINAKSKYNESELFDKLSTGDLKEFEKKSFIKILAHNKSKKLTEQLPSIIKDQNTPLELKFPAVWAAGKCKSEENFNLLLEMANNKDSINLEEREIALHSLAMSLRTNAVQVKKALNNVVSEKSDLSELATILLEKTEGRYYTKDKELAHLTEEEKSSYKQMRGKYLNTDFKMNIQQTNIVDRALKLFQKPLTELVGKDAKLYIMEDTATRAVTNDIGLRHIKKTYYQWRALF